VVYYSDIDSSIWVTDGTPGNTVQISSVKYTFSTGYLNGKIYFSGTTSADGNELYVTDGTFGGTSLVKDINAGAASSDPGDMVVFNGNLYFSAFTATEGREIWKSDGTSGGTTILKDIVSGTGSSNGGEDSFHLFTNGSFLLFAAESSGSGIELWKSDGTTGGTSLLKDINTGSDSSNPNNFYLLNSTILFFATDATHGEELWKTDGTAGGTVLVKDINPGTASSTSVSLFGFSFPLFESFHTFNNKAYFNATDGSSNGEIWSTDGTAGNTTMLADLTHSTTGFSFPLVIDAVNYPTKFFFPFGDGSTRSELWQSDGTSGGTSLFKSFTPSTAGDAPIIYIPFHVDFSAGTLSESEPLFQGNKFFFLGGSSANGNELWVSDGTVGGTNMVKDINPGTGDGIHNNQTYLYTTTSLYFAADDGTNGNELWVTDGTSGGTTIVKDINPNAGDANPEMDPFEVITGKIYFTATDGDDPTNTDLFVVNGSFTALPLQLTNFTVAPRNDDALLQWTIQQAVNSKDFTVQRSFNGQDFEDIGTVASVTNTSSSVKYSFTDAGIMSSGRQIAYYRLVENDQDGRTALTNVISLKISGNAHWNVRLLSNPVKDYISLLLSDISGNLQLTVRDVAGRVVYTRTLENENGQVSLPVNLERGVYLLEAVNNNERQVIRFVK
ncbi:MAG TPA: ELWxxDGT repeat protein, partial [Chitinophagaceae bacterium]|nr:ELWxxDGT repeat protein [Chitinophagaceae bacterium]